MTDTTTTTEHGSASAGREPSGGEAKAAIAELFQLIVGTDFRQAANDAALLVVQLATLSFLIERFGVDLDDIARRVDEVRASGVEAPLFACAETGGRCDAIVEILRYAYRNISPATTETSRNWKQ
jgi:hypothetical protein